MTKISDSMKRYPSELEERRDRLQAELASRQEVVARLRRQLEVRAAYILGKMESDPSFSPSPELLEALVQ